MSSSDLSEGSSDELISSDESETSDLDEEQMDEEKKVEPENPQTTEEDDPEKNRFIRELEFIQCLANPRYINWLASRNYFGDPAFINYLHYLQYWERPEYAKYLKYPQAIHFLRLLLSPAFRTYISDFKNLENVESEQFKYWQFYRRNRVDLSLPEVEVKLPTPKQTTENE